MHVRHFLSLLVVPLLAACSHMAQADTDIVGPIWIAEDVGGIPVPQGNDITLTTTTGDILDNPQNAYTQLLRASVPGPGWKPQRMRERLLGAQAAAEQ